MNKYQEALERLSRIDLDMVLRELNYDYEKANEISDYGIHDHPNLEMQGDLDVLYELIDKVPHTMLSNSNLNSYKSPIEVISSGVQIMMEDEVLKAVQDIGVKVDKKRLADLLKKDIPMSLTYEGDGYADGFMVYDNAYCDCGRCFDVEEEHYKFCPDCGQRLLW